MNMPKRYQRSRKKGWRKPHPGIVNCTAPGKWENPFRPTKEQKKTLGEYEVHLMARVAFKDWLENNVKRREVARLAKTELSGKDLMCYCKPHLPCHVDILLEIANDDS